MNKYIEEVDKKFTDSFWTSTQGYNDKRNKIIKALISLAITKAVEEGRQQIRRDLKDWTNDRNVTKESLRQKLNTLKTKLLKEIKP